MSTPPIQYTTYPPTTSSVPPTTTIPTLQTQAAQYQNHYPNVPVQIQPTSTYYSPYTTPAPVGTTTTTVSLGTPSLTGLSIPNDAYKQTNPAPARPPSPPEPSITPTVATRTIRRLIENEVIDVGFESAESQAVRRLEVEVVACACLSRSYFYSDKNVFV